MSRAATVQRAYYSSPIETFLRADPLAIFGQLAEQHAFDLEELQKSAWREQIRILKQALTGISGQVYFEFSIPRMGKRVDVILLSQGIVFVLEFKVGETAYPAYAVEQVLDYALDLKNFHETSHTRPIVPVLVATRARVVPGALQAYPDQVYDPVKVNAATLGQLIQYALRTIPPMPITAAAWEAGRYKPTPTIIEAAQALYRGHNVQEISRSDAGAINLSETSAAIDRIIEQTKRKRQKAICFITGVPGAGKTLAGLNIANQRLQAGENEHAVFLSGNGPLVIVLRDALVQDDMNKGQSRKDAARKAEAFIQNIHHFRDEYLTNAAAPLERVVIFDEAQRAWMREMAADFMRRKRGQLDFSQSEPEFLISVLDRHPDWAVIICLIGGGQEINTGEAGLEEWFCALQKSFPHWQVYVSQQLSEAEYLGSRQPADLLPKQQLHVEDRLHLAVSVRSYRSEKVSAWVKAVLDNNLPAARGLYGEIAGRYPIYMTRDLGRARAWLRQTARGSERFGLLASSGAARLRPEGIYVKAEIEVAHWFLSERGDVRASYALEGTATEFDIQGLELDWTAVAWDADLRYEAHGWSYRAFKGSKWQAIKDERRRMYLKNAYRVLLTRARQGMVIFVPRGDAEDEPRLPEFYDGTAAFLKQIGLQEI